MLAEEQREKERDSLHHFFAIDMRTEDVRKRWEKLKAANISQKRGENTAGKYKGGKGDEEASRTFQSAIFFCHSKLLVLYLFL